MLQINVCVLMEQCTTNRLGTVILIPAYKEISQLKYVFNVLCGIILLVCIMENVCLYTVLTGN